MKKDEKPLQHSKTAPGNRWSTITIQTPEGISFPLTIASPFTRLIALVVDLLCIAVATSAITTILGLARVISWDFAAAASAICAFVIRMGYPIALEWLWRGQTVGKRLVRIQVVDEQGTQLRFSQIFVRNILRVVDMMPIFYMVGGVSCLLTSRGQRIGDIMANTIVVQHPSITDPDLAQVLPDKYNSFKDYPHLAARLRQNASPSEAQIALEALLRRDQLDDEARLDLFSTIKQHMEQHARFPSEVTDGISDERYIRNVVDILFH